MKINRQTTKIKGFPGWLFFVLLVFSNQAQTQQDHTCQGGHNCNDGNGSVAVDVATGGDSTRLFSVGGSDMEISGCLATFSWLFGVRQAAKLNPDCEAGKEAVRLDKEGQHLAAAKMRCGTKLYRKRFGKGQACIDAVILDETLDVPNLAGLYNQAAQYDERYEQQQELEQQVEELAASNTVLQEQYEILIKKAVERPVTVQKNNPQPYLSDRQRAALKELFDESE